MAMSQNLNFIPAFDVTNYGYWKAHMRFFLKSIDVWLIVESDWTKPEDTTIKLIPQKNAWLANDKALHALCQAFSPSEFARISNCETTLEAWQILETTYEDTILVKSTKLQMLISRFEEINMFEEETFGEFYTKISDLRNSMVSFGKLVSDEKGSRRDEDWRVGGISSNLWVFPASSQEGKDALKASNKKARVSSKEDFDNEEDAVAMLAKNFERLMKNDKFKKKFTKRLKNALENLSLKKLRRTREVPDVLNAQALDIFELAVGISSRVKGRPTMRLSAMSQKKKKKKLLLNVKNF
jgi:hypothetical protein